MGTIYSRIDKHLRKVRRTWVSLCEDIGVKPTAAGMWKSRGVPPKYFSAIATALEMSREWVEVGIEDEPAKPAATEVVTSVGKRATDIAKLFQALPEGRLKTDVYSTIHVLLEMARAGTNMPDVQVAITLKASQSEPAPTRKHVPVKQTPTEAGRYSP